MTLLLDLHGISRSFGANMALGPVTLQLEPGCIGLLGPNGAGKSTLLKVLLGLIEPSAGHGFVMGQPLGGDRDGQANWKLRQLIGLMPEAAALVPGLTGVDYVALAGELYGMPRKQALRRAHEVLTALQLEEARYRKVEDYSAGMKQRVKLAQAIVHDPPVLLLDEPTSGLDPAGRDTMLNLIRQLHLNFGKSILLSTHLLADVQAVCERVVFLASGEIRGHGRVSDLLNTQKNCFRVKLSGNVDAARAALLQHGCVIDGDCETEAKITLPAGQTPTDLFRYASTSGAVVQRLIPHTETLEDYFFRTLGDG